MVSSILSNYELKVSHKSIHVRDKHIQLLDLPDLPGRNSCYRSADILVRLGLANAAEADKNVRAPFAFLHVLGNGELRPFGRRMAVRD